MKIKAIVRNSVVLQSAALFCCFSALYILFPTSLPSQHYDSLSYAYSAEAAGSMPLLGNHPLGHVIFNLSLALSHSIGYQSRALPVCQIANSLISGLCVSILFILIALNFRVKNTYALGCAILFGLTYSYWRHAGTADIYNISILFLSLTWFFLTKETLGNHLQSISLAGIAASLALASHQLSAVILPAGAVFLLLKTTERAVKLKAVFVFLTVAAVGTICWYCLLGYIATSSFSPETLFLWAQGYMQIDNPTYGVHFSTNSIPIAWETLSNALLISMGAGRSQMVRNGLLIFLLLIVLLGIKENWSKNTTRRQVLIAFAVQCLLSWSIILWWEPYNTKFYLLSLLPWCITLAICCEAFDDMACRFFQTCKADRLGRGIKYFFFTILFLIAVLNINYGKMREYKAVAAFNDAFAVWRDHSNPDDVLITAGDLVPHLLFWGNRPNTIHLYRTLQQSRNSADKFYLLRKEIRQALCNNKTVLLAPAACMYIADEQLSVLRLSRQELCNFFHRYEMKAVFDYQNLINDAQEKVYKLALPGTEDCNS